MSSTEALIDELLELDPSLADMREILLQIVEHIKTAQPDIKISEDFRNTLLRELHSKIEENTAPFSLFSFFSFMNQKFFFAGGGAIVGALCMLAWPQLQRTLPERLPESASQFSQSEIVELRPEGFGSFAPQSPAPTMSRGQGGGGGAGGGIPEKMIAADTNMIAPYEYYRTEYAYDGDIVLPTEDVDVFMRIKPKTKPSASSVLKGFAQNMIDWSKLSNLHITNISLQQNSSSAFSIGIDYNEGMINMYRNITAAERPDMYCNEPNCYEKNRLRQSDMLADGELIRIAQEFAKNYGLDLSEYGEPIVVNDWRIWYEMSEDKASYYFPDQLNVVFPLLINGKPVYEEYGMPFGMQVSVDVRLKEVTNMYNYSFLSYEQSAYKPFTDAEKAKQVLQRGSIHSWYDENAKVANATLGEPIDGYMTYYYWNPETQESKNLLLPALIFPVVNRDATATDYRQNVVLPLVQEAYNEDRYPEPYPMPMPVEPFDAPATEPAVLEAVE